MGPDGGSAAGARHVWGSRSRSARRPQWTQTTSDADGWCIPPLAAPGEGAENLAVADAAAGVTWFGVIGPGTTEVRLDAGATLDVEVLRTEDDAPVQGATVTVRSVDAKRGKPFVAAAATQADGRAVIEHVTMGHTWVGVHAPGRAPLGLRVLDVETTDVAMTVRLGAVRAVRGVVTLADGRPAPFAEVVVAADGASSEVCTDDDGAFEVDVPAAPGDADGEDGWPKAQAAWGGRYSSSTSLTSDRVVLTIADLPESTEELPELVQGTVRRADGRPVSRLLWCVVERSGRSTQRETRVGIDGRFRIFPSWRFDERTLYVYDARDEAGRRFPVRTARFDLPTDGGAEFEFELPASDPGLDGVVLGPDGRGVGDCEVYVLPAPSLETTPDSYIERGALATARTDALGCFHIDGVGGLGDGAAVVLAVPPGGFVRSLLVDTPHAGEPLTLHVAAAASAVIEVRDDRDRPLEGAIVYVVQRNREDSRENGRWTGRLVIRAKTGRDGRATVAGLDRSGAWNLGVTPPQGRRDLRLRSGGLFEKPFDVPHDTTLWMESGGLLRGRMTLADGTPASGATVLRGEDAVTILSRAGEDGTFEFPGERDGLPAPLRAVVAGCAAGPLVRAPTGAHADLTVDAGRHLMLEVTGNDALERLPVVIEPCTARQRGLTIGTRLVVGGFERTEGLAVLVGPAADGRCAVRTGVIVDGATVQLELGAGASVAGRVVAPPGRALARIEVSAARDGAVLAVATVDARTGAFRFPALPTGPWTLAARLRHGARTEFATLSVVVPREGLEGLTVGN